MLFLFLEVLFVIIIHTRYYQIKSPISKMNIFLEHEEYQLSVEHKPIHLIHVQNSQNYLIFVIFLLSYYGYIVRIYYNVNIVIISYIISIVILLPLPFILIGQSVDTSLIITHTIYCIVTTPLMYFVHDSLSPLKKLNYL